ncbi:MAG TPA: pitrilysin family protein [Micavibrio sp.]
MRKIPLYLLLGALSLPVGTYALPLYARENTPIAQESLTPAARTKVYNAESFKLANGMEFVVIPQHRAPVVTSMVWYRVGAADEPRGLSGMAHYLEHLLFKGTTTVKPGEFSKIVRALGGNDNAFTTQDYTAYYQSIAVEHLETLMRMEADRMINTEPPPADFKAERNVVLEERRQRTENDPRGYFSEQLRAMMFVNHPYATPVIGWGHEVAALEWPAIKKFYQAHYAPNNAIMVISGDITAAQLKPLAEKYFAPLKPIDLAPRQWTAVPPMIVNPQLTLRHAQIQQPGFIRLYRLPSATQNRKESDALSVLAEILDGGAATRLYKSLVVEQKIAINVGFDYDGLAVSDGSGWLSATPAEGVSLATVEQALEKELRQIIAQGVTDQELTEAKQRLKDSAAFALDSLSGPAMNVGRALITGLSLEDVEYWPDHIDQVTKEQVQAVAREYLNPDDIKKRPYVSGYLLPPEKAVPPAPNAAPPAPPASE